MSTLNIDDILTKFTSIEEISAFCHTLHKQNANLLKKNKELEDKVKELVAIKPINSGNLLTLNVNTSANDAKNIAQLQLQVLKNKSLSEELSMEDAKKLEIYNKVIQSSEEKNKNAIPTDATVLSDSDLINQLENLNESTK